MRSGQFLSSSPPTESERFIKYHAKHGKQNRAQREKKISHWFLGFCPPPRIYCAPPSESIFSPLSQRILILILNVLKLELKKDDWLRKYYFDHCNIKICNGFVSFYGDIFKEMDNHSYELMKTIVCCYLSIRFKSHARYMNEKQKKQNLRSKLMKIVLQNHQ